MGPRRAGERVDNAVWDAIRERYDRNTESLEAIAADYGLSRSTISTHAARFGWPLRPRLRSGTRRKIEPARTADEQASSGAGEGRAQVPETGKACRDPDPLEVRVQRLFRLVDMQIDAMETMMKTGEPLSPQDQERHARAMSSVLSNIEKITEAASSASAEPRSTEAEEGQRDGRAEAERMRREIAERLERLNAQWLARPDPE